MATAVRKTVGIAIGDLNMFVAGGGLPEGDYIIKDATIQMYQAPANQTSGKQSPARLGMMLTLIPYRETAKGVEYEEERTQFYSLGTKAHESFAPNPETGKGVVAVPGGPASTFNNSTNYAIFLKSLRDSGLPEGTYTDDCSVLEGMWVHMSNIPEPAERAGFQSQTGEVAGERRAGTIAVVSEIKDDGKPWEGSGGVPDVNVAPAPAAAKIATKVAAAGQKFNGKAGPATPVRAKAAPVAAPEPEGDEATQAAAISAISSMLEKNPKGLKKLQLRTGTFKAVNDAEGADMAQAVTNTFFVDDATLSGLLGELGFTLKGIDVVPM
jgi:hypothetical protein